MSDRKRICHVVQSYYPRDPRIRRQAEALAEAGFEVDVVCLRAVGENPREVVNGVNVTRLPLSRRRGSALRYMFEYGAFFAMASFSMLLRVARRYRVIHVSNLPDFLVLCTLVPKLFGARVLLDEHDPMPELFMSRYGVAAEHRLIRMIRWQERISVRFAHQVLTVSGAMKDRFVPVAGKVPVAVVMNLPDDRLFQPVERNAGSTVEEGKFKLLYTGTVSKVYDLAMVVEAVAKVRDRVPGLHLTIVGEGDDVPMLRDMSERLGIADRVEFCGVVPFNKIPEMIAASDVGVSTLKLDVLTNLCFNNKTAEYVAMGLPAIVTRNDVVAGHFPDGVIRFFDAGDRESFERAVLDLYENRDLRVEMSRRGIEFSRTSNWSTEKRRYIELIEGLCAGKTSAG